MRGGQGFGKGQRAIAGGNIRQGLMAKHSKEKTKRGKNDGPPLKKKVAAKYKSGGGGNTEALGHTEHKIMTTWGIRRGEI